MAAVPPCHSPPWSYQLSHGNGQDLEAGRPDNPITEVANQCDSSDDCAPALHTEVDETGTMPVHLSAPILEEVTQEEPSGDRSPSPENLIRPVLTLAHRRDSIRWSLSIFQDCHVPQWFHC